MSVKKRNGIYHCDFMVNGQRVRQTLETEDWREAVQKERELEAMAGDGKLSLTSAKYARLSFTEAVSRYLEDRKPYLSPRTITTERERAKPLKAFFADTKLKTIDAETVRQYITNRKRAGLANKTVNLELELIRGTLKRAHRWHLIAEEIKPLPVNHDTGRALEPHEKDKLLEVAASNPDWQVAKCATILALTTTMRKVEIRGLQWRRVNLIEKTLTVLRKTTKTDAGERIIPLNDDSLGAILEMRERAKALFGDNLSPDWYVFFRHEGYTHEPDPTKPMGVTGWRTAFRKIVKSADLPGFRFHDLRHHAITELAEGQASDMTIMSIAGHISKRMLDHYSHTRMDAKRQAIEALSTRKNNAVQVGYGTNHGTNQVNREAATQ